MKRDLGETVTRAASAMFMIAALLEDGGKRLGDTEKVIVGRLTRVLRQHAEALIDYLPVMGVPSVRARKSVDEAMDDVEAALRAEDKG